MSNRPRIYLDNAATSWPKPPAVYDAVDDYQRRLGAAVGRGGYAEAEEVGNAVEATRAAVARLIGAESPERIIFTFNGTDSLNLAIHGTLRPGDHVITTVVEHNSVLRPLRRLEKQKRIAVTRVGCDATGVIDPSDIRKALRPETKLIIVTHASNVTGAIQPVVEIGAIAREQGVLFLVDAAQTLGHLPVSVAELGADLLAAPGHKGMLGPLGTGILYIRSGVEQLVNCVRQGGTGSSSSSVEHPDSLPEKYESGNHNAPGIIGLGAGLKYIATRGIENIRQHAIRLTDLLLNGLQEIPGIEFFGPKNSMYQIGVVSSSLPGRDPLTLAKHLEEHFGIQVRAGFQCAALMHRSLGTLERRGTVRFSVGPFNTTEDIAAAVTSIAEITIEKVDAVASAHCPCVVGNEHARPSAQLIPAASAISMKSVSGQSTDISALPGLHELWSKTLGDPRVCIAVLDGPVDLSHPCFRGANVAVHPSTVPTSTDSGAATQHGTHVASEIFGQHDSEIKGIAPNCRGVVIPVFRDGIDGSVIPCSQIELARAITLAVQYAKEQEAAALVINISGGQFSPSGEAHPLLKDVVDQLDPELHLIVAATGNQGCDCLHIPGALPSVLAVGAMNTKGMPLPFSNWGKAYQVHGLLAPGEDILGASVGNGTNNRTGTSYATPVVSGLAALLLSHQIILSGIASANGVRNGLLRSAVNCDQEPITDCQRLLVGRLDVPAALQTLFNKGPHDMNNDLQLATATTRAVAAQNQGNAPIPPCDADVTSTETAPSKIVPATATCPVAGTLQQDAFVMPAGCGCGGSPSPVNSQKVYAIGRLSYDFGTRQRREYFRSQIGNPDDHAALVSRLKERTSDDYAILEGKQFASRADVTALSWILMIDETPVYAMAPVGPFAFDTHDTLVQFLTAQLPPKRPTAPKGISGEGVERMALAGQIAGETRLYTGEVVPVVAIDHRGLANWTTKALVEAMKKISAKDVDERVETILDRLYELTRNLGLASRDRALNYAATNALVLQIALADDRNKAKFADMELDSVDVHPSPICRPDYDCWEVVFTFYDPDHLTRARRGLRFTIDVSDTLPQLVAGSERSFSLR